MATKTGVDILSTTSLTKQAKEALAKPVVPKQSSQGFIRRKMRHGRPYYYLVKSVRVGDKVKQVILQYLGTRKPRGYNERH